MKKTMKRLIALVLAMAMGLSLLSANVWAAEVLPQEAETSTEEVGSLADVSLSAQSTEEDSSAPVETEGVEEQTEDESAPVPAQAEETESEPEPVQETEEQMQGLDQEAEEEPTEEGSEDDTDEPVEKTDEDEQNNGATDCEGEKETGEEDFSEERFFDPFHWDGKAGKNSNHLGEGALTAQSAKEYNPRSGYGGELSDTQRRVYDALVKHYIGAQGLSNGVTNDAIYSTDLGIGVRASTQNELFNNLYYAYWAFVYDYPEMFWAGGVSISISCEIKSGEYDLKSAQFSIQERYSGAKAAIETYNEGVKTAADQIYHSVTTGQMYDYFKAIHDWMCDTMSYRDEAIEQPERYAQAYSSGPVFTGDPRVTCQGYGETFKVLCDQIRIRHSLDGLYCAEIAGRSYTGATHMWNYVWIDNLWFAMDTLWDDQKTRIDNYFLCGSNSKGIKSTFREEHIEDNSFSEDGTIQFTYPVIEEKAYKRKYTPSVNGWGFPNYEDTISEEIFYRVYDKTKKVNQKLYDKKKNKESALCQGMAFTSALSFLGKPGISTWGKIQLYASMILMNWTRPAGDLLS